MKKILLIAALVGLTVPFARMVIDMAKNAEQHEVGISSSQINPKQETKYFELK